MADLVLFTQSYPYAVAMENTFIEPELPYLRAAFERVIVVPVQCGGARTRVPADVEVDESLAERLAGASRLELGARALRSPLARRELLGQRWIVRNPRALRALAWCAGRADLVRTWAGEWLARRGLSAGRCVAYTFWCDEIAVGLAQLKVAQPALVVASRAHGIDLYAERHEPPYLPCRELTLRQLDGLFPDSERGVRYVAEQYPWFAARCQPALMGVGDPGFVAKASNDRAWSVVSCSRLVAVKRVDLIARAVAEAARRMPALEMRWQHFGEGPLRGEIEAIVKRELPDNARAELAGYPSHEALMDFYRTQPVDVFVNASSSEGTPVAIMEAVSCGIPVIATAVGGNPEIASDANGVLVSADPAPSELADALVGLARDRRLCERKRLGSRSVWHRKYDAAHNYATFANRLRELRAAR